MHDDAATAMLSWPFFVQARYALTGDAARYGVLLKVAAIYIWRMPEKEPADDE